MSAAFAEIRPTFSAGHGLATAVSLASPCNNKKILAVSMIRKDLLKSISI
jgi:hypothetical protein